MVRGLEQRFGLPVGSGDHIDADEGKGECFPDAGYPAGKEFRSVLAFHQGQDLIGPCLKRDVKVGHDDRGSGHPINDFIGKQVGFH